MNSGPSKVHFLCPRCQCQLTAPAETVGRTGRCRGCGEAVTVPSQPAAAAVPMAELVLLDDVDGPLTACSACGRSIAKEAATCPGCGSPNKWTHPEIIRFYREIRRFKFEPSIEVKHEKWILTGVDHGANKGARSIADLANRIGIIGDLGTVLAADAGRIWLNRWANSKAKAFRMDFATKPPTWVSTDDEYWLDVMAFFGLPRPRRKRRRPPVQGDDR